MDPELQELLARLNDDAESLTDEELRELNEKVVAIAADIDPANASDDDIAVLAEAVDAHKVIQAQVDVRETAAAERASKAEELRSAIVPPKAEDGAGDAPADGEKLDEEKATPESGGDAPAEGEEPAKATPESGGDAAPETPTDKIEEPVAASAERRIPSISRLAHRTPRSHKPQPTATEKSPKAALIASADMPGLQAGQVVTDLEQFAHAAARKIETYDRLRGGNGGNGEKISFGHIAVDYPEDRFLGGDEYENEEKLDAVTSKEALVAAGGVCAPVAADYSVQGVSVADRPVRDGLAQFGANRGGVRYVLPFTLSGVSALGPANAWTQANDIALNNPATKPHATFTCQTVKEDLVDAVTSISEFGNFQARFFPELIEQFLQTVNAVHARLAEATSLGQIHTGSTQTTTGVNLLGAAADLLAEVDRAAAALRYRNRMAADSPLRIVYPEWLEDLIRADLSREAPGNSGGQSERLAVADAEIDRFFTTRNINVTTTLDAATGVTPLQGFVGQANGQLLPWPAKVAMWLYPEGSWVFLDGGTLDLGMVRDATLNAKNSFQMFSETFEKTIFRGVESLEIIVDTCVSGQRANLVDSSSYCGSGS